MTNYTQTIQIITNENKDVSDIIGFVTKIKKNNTVKRKPSLDIQQTIQKLHTAYHNEVYPSLSSTEVKEIENGRRLLEERINIIQKANPTIKSDAVFLHTIESILNISHIMQKIFTTLTKSPNEFDHIHRLIQSIDAQFDANLNNHLAQRLTTSLKADILA